MQMPSKFGVSDQNFQSSRGSPNDQILYGNLSGNNWKREWFGGDDCAAFNPERSNRRSGYDFLERTINFSLFWKNAQDAQRKLIKQGIRQELRYRRGRFWWWGKIDLRWGNQTRRRSSSGYFWTHWHNFQNSQGSCHAARTLPYQ